MAKGQQRGNREPKKPKKERPKGAAAAPGSVWLTLEKTRSPTSHGKKS
jgi:hypothetical protein